MSKFVVLCYMYLFVAENSRLHLESLELLLLLPVAQLHHPIWYFGFLCFVYNVYICASNQENKIDGTNLIQQGRGAKKPEIATVIAPYSATSGEQLSLQRGQLIMIRKKSASGWWEGELQVNYGSFGSDCNSLY